MRTGVVEANLVRLNEMAKLPYLDELIQRKIAGAEKERLSEIDVRFHQSEYERLRNDLQQAYEASRVAGNAFRGGALHDLFGAAASLRRMRIHMSTTRCVAPLVAANASTTAAPCLARDRKTPRRGLALSQRTRPVAGRVPGRPAHPRVGAVVSTAARHTNPMHRMSNAVNAAWFAVLAPARSEALNWRPMTHRRGPGAFARGLFRWGLAIVNRALRSAATYLKPGS